MNEAGRRTHFRVPHNCLAGAIGAIALITLVANGCASPGPPRSPTLNLSTVVTDLSADRIGNDVVLHWTTPEQTTDGLDITGSLTAKICRVSAAAGSLNTAATGVQSGACVPVQQIPVRPGPSLARDLLPSPLRVDPARLLLYRIEILNSSDRSAGLSSSVSVASGSAPPAIESLRVAASPGGAVIEWQAASRGNLVELDRKLEVAPIAPKPTGDAIRPTNNAIRLSAPPPSEVRLRAQEEAANKSTATAGITGGMVDPGARLGESYRYSASRIRQIALDGKSLEIRSPSSQDVLVVMKDVFPPETPKGLESVSNLAGDTGPSVDLSWQPNQDSDLAGYFVYRRIIGALGSSLERLNSGPLVTPAFHDRNVQSGHTYAYSVSAVDLAGNESAASGEVQEKLSSR